MFHRVIDLVEKFSQAIIEGLEIPYRPSLGVIGFRYLANVLHNLSISTVVVNKLVVSGSEESLTNGAKASLCWRARLLCDLVPRHVGIEIGAVKFASTVY